MSPSALSTQLTIDALRQDVAAALDEPVGSVGDDDDLLRLGLDSISVMRLAAGWQQRGANVTFSELIEWRTLAHWWQLVSTRLSAPATVVEQTDPAEEYEPFDLAVMQHAYWVGRADGRPLGGVGAHFYAEFDGVRVNPQRLESAVRALLLRHAMLRAAIDDHGRQRVLPESPWPGLAVHDLRDLSADGVTARLTALRDDLAHRRLDVRAAQVFDIQLSLLPDGGTRTHVQIEMLVADAHSFRALMSDLAALYADPDAALPPIGYSYRRYLTARGDQRDRTRDRARDYWQRRLAELPGAPELPLARDPEHVTGHRVVRRHRWLDAAETDVLAARARQHGLTPSVVFLTAFGDVLGRWSANHRFLLNLPLYDRQPLHPDVAHLVGDFTNLLLLEVDSTVDDSFVTRAHAVQDRLRSDAAHAAFTGVEVLRELAKLRGGQAAGAPVVFTSALNLGELFDAEVLRCLGQPAYTMSQTPQVWLDFQVTEREGRVYLNWDCVDEIFPAGLVDDMFAAYGSMVDWLLAPGSDWEGAQPELLPEATRRTRELANDTDAPTRPRGLHEDFFALAEQEPNRTALCWGERGVCTYGDLAARARRLAARLLDAGLRGGDPVAITLPKGPSQVVAVLAVLCGGGVYVPVGVDQPVQRRNRIFGSAGVRLVIAGRPLADLPEGVHLVDVADRPDGPLAEPVAVLGDELAYILFTSGSTGEPKGVMVPHRAAVNTIDAINARFTIGADDRVVAVSALDFDLSVYDMFGMLSVGGALVCIGEEERRDAARWVALAQAHRVTIWQSVPALLDMLLTASGSHAVAASTVERLPLRLALLGGDWVGLDLAARLHAAAPGARLIGLGGTTETAIHSTVQEAPVDPPAAWRSVPYGVPLPNQRMRVCDARGADSPDWVPGELWIGGGSVAAGYRGDPERTARHFVVHSGRRWYRTGDLARYWPDGTVEFLGRADFQVKLRGHRIELGEIEAALERQPGVARAVAAVVGEGPRRRLVAAVVGSGADLSPDDLRAGLSSQVPSYMVPERVRVVDAFPLSANGKIDRRAVGVLLADEPAREEFAPPEGDIEQAVADIWAELLGTGPVGRGDSFFALGGDSLTATRLLARLGADGLAGAELRALFANPSLSAFCANLSRGTATSGEPALATDPAHRHDPFPATDVQRAYWLGRTDDFALGGVGSHWYWEFDGSTVDLPRLEDAVNTLIARHDMLRAVFGPDGQQRVLPEVPRFTIEVGEGDDAVTAMREELAHRVPDPATWPLIEIRAVRYGDDRVRIAFSFDYIVLDALSIVIFFAELSTLYRDPHASLPDIGVTFRDYVVGATPDPARLAADEKYWIDRLPSLPPAPTLPLAVDPDQVTAPRFTRREHRLDPARWQAVTRQARRHQVTPAAVLLCAFAEVLAAWSGRPDLTLNLTMFNRRDVHPDIQRVLGDFTSLLLVDHHSRPGEHWLTACRRLQDTMWGGLEHNSVSAIWVLREMARRTRAASVSVPVVFTSALGVSSELVNLDFPFGSQVWGVSQTPQVWLDNQVMERDGGLSVNWDCVDELFPDGLLDAMFTAYTGLLDHLADTDWEAPAPELLPAAQRAVRDRVNDTAGPRPWRTLHEEFFTRARTEPGRTAVCFGDDEWTYGQLADAALRIGGALRERGVRPGDAVGVTVPRGPEQLAAVLGVLAAGGAYVPVGIDQPVARRDRIHARAGVRVVVAPAHLDSTADVVPPGVAATPLDEPYLANPDTLAYTIFTSGSTGEPKGVEISHAAALNTVDDINTRFGVGPDDRVLAVSALDFDLSVYDIFGPLSVGGALVLIGDDERREARRWAALVRAHRVTLWNSVPALADMLLVAGDPADLATLRFVFVSGDWVGLDLPGRLTAAVPGARLVAMGGATEAAIWSNALEVPSVPAHWRSVPYGFPLRNQRYRVVDPAGRDCPDWVPGELWIGGVGVALGYRNDPRTTVARFVIHHGQRWYRTGDLGRYWPDGTLEFLGRVDFQVKLRGHRIELGEIEAAARAYPHIAQAVAVTVGEGTARKLALAVVHDGPGLAGLRELLAERLPTYMVPERIEALDALPLSANGKVDRSALARQLDDTGPDEAEDEPPRGQWETLLAGLWAELLPHDTIGRRQSFFALGGDSLLATRLVDTLRRGHGIELSLRQLFAEPTLAGLGALVAAQTTGPDGQLAEEGVL